MNEYEAPPESPVKIDKKARKIFIELFRILRKANRWADGDAYALAVLSQAYADLDVCREAILEDGLFYTSKTLKRKHPATELQRELINTIEKFTGYFQFAPKFRDKADNTSQDDPLEKFKSKYGAN
jgi:P27 family predicted phage terminase small subunit